MINDTLKRQFQLEGFIILRDFINEEVINEINKELNQLNIQNINIDKKNLDKENNEIKYLKHTNFYCGSVNKIINAKLLNIISILMNENIYFSIVEYHNKFPGCSESPPHQDNYYFNLLNANAVTAYLALNKQNEKNGGLAVVKGSHIGKTREHDQSMVKAFSSGINLNKKDLNNIEKYELNSGDLAIHHCNIIHMAPPNKTKNDRRALAYRFYGESARLIIIEMSHIKKIIIMKNKING